MYFGSIELRNWKNFKHASATLRERVFLIGPNASGKSNLLDAFRFLRDVAGIGLRTAVESRGGVASLRCLAARQYSSISIQVVIAEDDAPKWEYLLEFNQDSSKVPTVKREIVRALDRDAIVLERPDEADRNDPLRLTQTALEQIIANQPFRSVADFFASISYQHLVPQVVRDPRNFSAVPVQNDPFGRDFLLRIWNAPARTRDAWLRRICTGLRVAVPQLSELSVEMDAQGAPHLVGRYEHWRPHAAKQNESQFSDGTLRLFGLLWSMFEGGGPLLLEEPELSLHSEIVRRLPQVFEEVNKARRLMKKTRAVPPRQLIVSTHSPELLDDPGIAAEEVLRLEPGPEGTVIQAPSVEERGFLAAGMTVAYAVLPRSAPKDQLEFSFDQP